MPPEDQPSIEETNRENTLENAAVEDGLVDPNLESPPDPEQVTIEDKPGDEAKPADKEKPADEAKPEDKPEDAIQEDIEPATAPAPAPANLQETLDQKIVLADSIIKGEPQGYSKVLVKQITKAKKALKKANAIAFEAQLECDLIESKIAFLTSKYNNL